MNEFVRVQHGLVGHRKTSRWHRKNCWFCCWLIIVLHQRTLIRETVVVMNDVVRVQVAQFCCWLVVTSSRKLRKNMRVSMTVMTDMRKTCREKHRELSRCWFCCWMIVVWCRKLRKSKGVSTTVIYIRKARREGHRGRANRHCRLCCGLIA